MSHANIYNDNRKEALMKPEKIKELCIQQQGASYDFKEEWNADRGLIGGKMFSMLGEDKQGNRIISLKCVPEEGQDLRLNYPETITEGYYLNKRHWISIKLDTEIDEKLVEKLIRESYQLVLNSFSKKKQAELKAL